MRRDETNVQSSWRWGQMGGKHQNDKQEKQRLDEKRREALRPVQMGQKKKVRQSNENRRKALSAEDETRWDQNEKRSIKMRRENEISIKTRKRVSTKSEEMHQSDIRRNEKWWDGKKQDERRRKVLKQDREHREEPGCMHSWHHSRHRVVRLLQQGWGC